jgi:hypothetical protein
VIFPAGAPAGRRIWVKVKSDTEIEAVGGPHLVN